MELNFLSELLDLAVLIALIGIVEAIKGLDKKANEHGVLYFIIFAGVSLAAGIFIALQEGSYVDSISIGIGASLIKFIKYFGIGTVFYKFIVKWIKTKTGGGGE